MIFRITREGATAAQKAALIKGASQLLAIDELETDNRGIGGESFTVRRQAGR